MKFKKLIIDQIIEKLRKELDLLATVSRDLHADASNEQNKAEDKYDTRGLETAYLASAQARQATEIEQALNEYQGLELKEYSKDSPIGPTALVELQCLETRTLYFIGPKSGGLEIKSGDKEIVVITPESPLGSQMIGKKVGDLVSLQSRGPKQNFLVISVT